MVSYKNIFIFNIFLLLLFICYSKDVNTFSNYEQITQKKLELNFNINFTEKKYMEKSKHIS